MRAFVASDIAKIRNERLRVRALISKLGEYGYYTNFYDADLSRDAADTFARRQGNCLSYTNMFIALAREAGLDAQFEIVKTPPMYSVSKGVLEHQVHIRVHVQLPLRSHRERYLTVDFNRRNIREFDGKVISDQFAKSLHLANLAVEYWHDGHDQAAFSHMVRAIKLEPRHADHWTNLATFYKRRGKTTEALQLNRYALSLDRTHMVALSGVVQHAHGEELSRARTMLKRQRTNNPYYQFALAQRAHAQDHLEDALHFVDQSLRLDNRNHQFFELKGKILQELEHFTEARENYQRALNFAPSEQEKQRYRRALLAVERFLIKTPMSNARSVTVSG